MTVNSSTVLWALERDTRSVDLLRFGSTSKYIRESRSWEDTNLEDYEFAGIGKVEKVDETTEFDEGTEVILPVIKVDGRLFQVQIYNDSWQSDNGAEITDVTEVEPYEVTVTKYRRVR